MIICSSSNIDLIQGVSGYGTAADGATDWRIENTATGVFNILNSPNLLTPNVSIIDAGNIGIGTIPVSGTNKLQVQGNLNVSGGYFVAGVALKPATAVLADTATILATSRNIAGVGFTGAGNIDIPYFNLINKITAGNGISLTAGSAAASPSISTNLTAGNGISISAAASPSISTNLTAGNGISISAAASPVITANITAGTNITFTGTNPISISAAGGTASQWTTTGANIYYNSGNVGIGTNNPLNKLHVEGSLYANGTIQASGATIWANNVWNNTNDGRNRIYFSANDTTYFKGGSDYNSIIFRNASDTTIAYFTAAQFYCYGPTNLSDRRIKRDIVEINDETALNMLLLIQPTTYYYRDEARNKGNGKVYGFIAQQIKEVIPDAVSITSNIIANIYKTCLVYNKREIYHSIPQDIAIDTEVQIFKEEGVGGKRYKIKEIYEDHFVIDDDIDADECFVFGYCIDDLHGLDKSYIYTLNVCATQELHRRMEAQNVIIKSQDERIKDLETKVAMLMSNM